MRSKWLVTLTLATVLCSGFMFAQREETITVINPIIATIDGYDAGLTVINVCNNPLTMTNFVYYGLDGTKRALPNLRFTVPANGRFSKLASELVGPGANGSIRYSLIGNCSTRALAYEGILSPDFNTAIVPAEEFTRRMP